MLVLDDYAMRLLHHISVLRKLLPETAELRFNQGRRLSDEEFFAAIADIVTSAKRLVSSQVSLSDYIIRLAYGAPPKIQSFEDWTPSWYLEIPPDVVDDLIEEHSKFEGQSELAIWEASIQLETVSSTVSYIKIAYHPITLIETLYEEALEEIGER